MWTPDSPGGLEHDGLKQRERFEDSGGGLTELLIGVSVEVFIIGQYGPAEFVEKLIGCALTVGGRKELQGASESGGGSVVTREQHENHLPCSGRHKREGNGSEHGVVGEL